MLAWPRVSPAGLRLISGGWALWSWITALAYLHKEPSSLDPVSIWLPLNLAWTWAFIALLLTLGAVLPRHGKTGKIARGCATLGTAFLAGMLAAFMVAYGLSDGRGWVSAKNYAALTVAAFICSRLLGRGHGEAAK